MVDSWSFSVGLYSPLMYFSKRRRQPHRSHQMQRSRQPSALARLRWKVPLITTTTTMTQKSLKLRTAWSHQFLEPGPLVPSSIVRKSSRRQKRLSWTSPPSQKLSSQRTLPHRLLNLDSSDLALWEAASSRTFSTRDIRSWSTTEHTTRLRSSVKLEPRWQWHRATSSNSLTSHSRASPILMHCITWVKLILAHSMLILFPFVDNLR